MKRHGKWTRKIIAMANSLVIASSAMADTTITTFDDFFYMDGLFLWADATVTVTETNYAITDIGYGSGYKDINPNVDASGETNIQLTVTLAGPSAADGHLGPIVSLVDGDGTFVNFAWYGQTLGTHVLNAALSSPTWTASPGTVPGLDLATLDFFHLQLDPGGFGSGGAYTVTFEDLRLTGVSVAAPVITAQSYNPTTQEFTLTWSSLSGKNYLVLHSADLSSAFSPLLTDIPSGGSSTTTTVTIPAGNAGFLRIQQQ